MTDAPNEVRKITDPHELLDWTFDQAIKAKPQIEMTKAFLTLLNEQVAQIHQHGCLPVAQSTIDYIGQVLFTLSEPGEAASACIGLVGLMANLIRHQVEKRGSTEFHSALFQLAVIAKVDKGLKVGMSGDNLIIMSSPRLTRRHKVIVEVVLPFMWRVEDKSVFQPVDVSSFSGPFIPLDALSRTARQQEEVGASSELPRGPRYIN